MRVRGGTTKGFTLVELLAVAVILGIAGSFVGLSGIKIASQTGLDQLTSRVSTVDRLARYSAIRTGMASTLELNLDAASIMFRSGGEDDASREFALPGPWKVEVITTPEDSARFGTVSIAVGRQGQSVPYALALEANEDDRVWLLVDSFGSVRVTREEADASAHVSIQ